MSKGLSVSRLVKVAVNLQPLAVPRRNFGVLLIAGDTDVIDGEERIRSYTDIEGVAVDFGTTDPEYKAALAYFSQSPRPALLYIGRWVRQATVGRLVGGSHETDPDAWKAVADGAFKIDIDGAEASLTGMDFSACDTLAEVAAVIHAKLATVDAACAWDGTRFVVTSETTGADSTLGYAIAPTAGTDIGPMAGLTASLAYVPVPGFDSESPEECVQVLADKSGQWYGLTFAASTMPTDDQLVAVAGFVEAASRSRVMGITVADPRTASSVYTLDIASRLKALGYDRTIVQYSSSNPYAVCSILGRAFTVNFSANRSCITLMYKGEPGVVAETLSESQANALKAKNCNVFVNYDNGTAIIQHGTVASGAFFDEIHGLDWLTDAIQTECWNLLYQSKTKIPQTEEGVGQFLCACSKVCQGGVGNGLLAPGVWNADGFGQLRRGDYLPKGYYLYSQPIVDQSQSEREERKAPPIQVAAKLAGAIHIVDVQIDVNR